MTQLETLDKLYKEGVDHLDELSILEEEKEQYYRLYEILREMRQEAAAGLTNEEIVIPVRLDIDDTKTKKALAAIEQTMNSIIEMGEKVTVMMDSLQMLLSVSDSKMTHEVARLKEVSKQFVE